ncbi:urease accessory protein [Apiospora arundinis]
MPHKHTRRDKDVSTYDLPPTQVAKSLPVTKLKNPKKNTRQEIKESSKDAPPKNAKRKRETEANDAPRAFRRLMALSGGKRTRSGLDNGDDYQSKNKKKKQKSADSTAAAAPVVAEVKETVEVPKIKPGERLSEYSARVDQALPLAGLISKTTKQGKDPLGGKVWRTKKERQMHKLYDEWREEERKIKEKREEELEEQAEKEAEEEETGVSWKLHLDPDMVGGKKGKKGKRARLLGEANDDEEDPWAELKRKRGETRKFNDVAKAPPELPKLNTAKLLKSVRGAGVSVDNVPKASGSLRRREELQTERENVIAAYRKMMESKHKTPALS